MPPARPIRPANPANPSGLTGDGLLVDFPGVGVLSVGELVAVVWAVVGICRLGMHLVSMAGGTGGDTGGEAMIRDGMHIGGAGFEMTQVAVHATDTLLIVLGIGKSHGDFAVAVDAKR